MKKILVVITMLLTMFSGVAYAEGNGNFGGFPTVNVNIDGEQYAGDIPAIKFRDSTMVPAEYFAEYMAASVEWNRDNNSIHISTEDEDKFKIFEPLKDKKQLTTVQLSELTKYTVLIECFDGEGEFISRGSGIIIGDGTIVTNYHVLKDAYTFQITDNDENIIEFKDCQILGWSFYWDLALIKIPNAKEGLTIATSKTKLGEDVITIGCPLGLNSVSTGIISGYPEVDGQSYIQTSAPISPGSSGGALLNTYGEIIGITSASMVRGQNINLAIPSDKLLKYLNRERNNPSRVLSYENEDGSTYFGEVDIYGYPHGKGKLTYPNGEFMEGTFQHGDINGNVSINLDENTSYVGYMKNDKQDGYGIIIAKDEGLLSGNITETGFQGVVLAVSEEIPFAYGTMKDGKKNGIFFEIYSPREMYIVEYKMGKEIFRKQIDYLELGKED